MTRTDSAHIYFKTQKQWRAWLLKNYAKSGGVWLQFYKKNSGIKGLNYAQALEEALCFGWIDGQAKKYDEESYIQKFTPRRKRSSWSKKNTEKAEILIKEGTMHSAGLAEIEKAKADGRWERAYESPANAQIPDDFLKDLSKKPEALKFFETLDKTNKYSIVWRLQTARKSETRRKRISVLIDMLEQKKKFH